MLEKSNGNITLTTEEQQIMIDNASDLFGKVLTSLKYDWENDSNMKDTPRRFIKSLVNDLCKGNYQPEPKITAFDNVDEYEGLVFQGNIELTSLCSHHLLGFNGKCHVAYIPSRSGKIIGLSKLNRIVDFYARRPQVQENLTMQIHRHINSVCSENLGVAVMIEANHTCCSNRGIKHNSTMKTAILTGSFDSEPSARAEFYSFINNLK